MSWLGKNHLENLKEILLYLQWFIQPDTVITELPYDLEFLKKTDIENFAEWCPKSVSRQELEEGRYTINKYLVRFFVDTHYPNLSEAEKEQKTNSILDELHRLLNLSSLELIYLNPKNISKIIDTTHNKPGESHIDKTKKRIKIAVALRWLQNKDLHQILSSPTREYITHIGDLYGQLNQGKSINTNSLHKYAVSSEDIKKITADYETKIELSLLSATEEIKNSIKENMEMNYGGLGVVMRAVERLKKYIERKHPKEYDRIDCFKDSIFITIILNYVKDPYIQNTPEAKNIVKLIVPIFVQYKNLEKLY
uniref:Uncharacterized protein n=1 Tax=candidate division WOR-3 bacterium TaxID=2052148 RepID=A0A7C4X9D6_UNCW3